MERELKDLEKLKQKYSEQGVEISIFEKLSDPHPVEFCKIYKEIEPQPQGMYDIGIAHLTVEKYKDIGFEEWDMSRDDEPPYSTKAYMLVSEITGIKRTEDRLLEEIDKRVEEIFGAEKEYSQKVKKPRINESKKYIEIFGS